MIFHIDIDAFFATVEINKNPELRYLPVVVCGKTQRSVVSSANYLARSYGIKAGMSVAVVNSLCPKAVRILLDDDSFTNYEQISEMFLMILANNFGKNIEQVSIDECFLEIANIDYDAAVSIAWKIKKMVLAKLNLTITIGIGPNKFFARMATQFGKPNGLYILNDRNFKRKVWPLAIDEMFFIGKKSAEKLHKIGIFTIGQFATFDDQSELKRILGKNYSYHLGHANGICYEKVELTKNALKSISSEKTFASDIYEEQEFLAELYSLCQRNYQRMIHKGLMCKTIHLKLKYFNFQTRLLSHTFDDYTRDFKLIYNSAIKLFENHYQMNDNPIRLIGISFSNLFYISDCMKIRTLFDNRFSKTHWQLLRIIVTVNKQIGEHVLDFACNLLI